MSSRVILIVSGVLIACMGVAGFLIYRASLEIKDVDNQPAAVAKAKEELSEADRARVSAATVMLHVTDLGQSVHCAGFFCRPGLVATDIAVFGDVSSVNAFKGTIQVVTNCGVAGKEAPLDARLTALDSDARLAFVRVIGADLPAPLQLGTAHDLRDNSPVYVAGFNWAKPGDACPVNVLNGNVRSLEVRKSGTTILEVNAPVGTGNRGAPVVDYKGRVVGMLPGNLRTAESSPTTPPEDLDWSLNGHISNLKLKTTSKDDTLYTFDVTFELVNPAEQAIAANFYYSTSSRDGENMTAVPLVYDAKTSTCKCSIPAVNIRRAGNLWSQTGIKLAGNPELKTNIFDRAAELGVPGAVMAEVPLPAPRPEPRYTASPAPPAYKPAAPPPPPPPPDSPGWTFGYQSDESTNRKSGSYENAQTGGGKEPGVIVTTPGKKR